MTTEELNTIVEAVVAELEKNGVDFDNEVKEAQDTDLVFVIRETDSGYGGFKVTWKGLLDIITAQATQAKNDAETAKNAANTILTQVQSKGTEITNFVATSKSEIETQKNESVETVRGVYRDDLNAESTARQTADNTLQQNIDSEASTRAEADTALGARIDSETTTRESEVAELERVNAIQKYEIENLKAKAEGQIYREEIVDANTYKLDIPSSVAPYAEVQKIGGKSVVWNQLAVNGNFEDTSNWINGYTIDFTVNNNVANLISKESYGSIKTNITNILKGHKILLTFSYMGNDVNWYYYGDGKVLAISKTPILPKTEWYDYSAIFTVSNEYDMDFLIFQCDSSGKHTLYLKKVQIIDLTQMFGSRNEPSLEECKKIFSADYYPYDTGTLKSFPVQRVKSLKADGTEIGNIDVSSLTEGLKSAGSVADEWINGKVTKRVRVTKVKNLNLQKSTDFGGTFIGYITDQGYSNTGNCICGKLQTVFSGSELQTYDKALYAKNNGLNLYIRYDSANGDVNTLLSLIGEEDVYYQLATPTEESVPEIDNYINVEGGGTLTFESDDAVHMPVPSTDRFVVDLS